MSMWIDDRIKLHTKESGTHIKQFVFFIRASYRRHNPFSTHVCFCLFIRKEYRDFLVSRLDVFHTCMRHDLPFGFSTRLFCRLGSVYMAADFWNRFILSLESFFFGDGETLEDFGFCFDRGVSGPICVCACVFEPWWLDWLKRKGFYVTCVIVSECVCMYEIYVCMQCMRMYE